MASLIIFCALVFVILYLVIDIPKPNPQAQQQVSVVYYADGKTEMGRYTVTNREPISLQQVPLSVQRDFLSAEDRTFYQNRGISPTGIARAFLKDFSGGSSQGGSTITQQYVKNYFLSQDRTVTRKVKEIIISLKIDQEHSKNQILQDYLNNVYFGRGAYGIQAASKSYFHKDVTKLTPVEGAFLASVVNNPDNMDPLVGPNSAKRANQRMAYVLNGMVKMKWMTQAERNAAVMPTFYKREPAKYVDGPNGYIIQSVRNELATKLNFSQSDIDRGGLRITTTIDKATEDKAVKAVQENLPTQLGSKLHAGLVAEKPNDGAIVAMYGGADYNPVTSPYSDADQALLQAASGMKLYTAIAALQNGKSINSLYNGNTGYKIARWQYVSNDGGESFGDIPIRTMLAYSVNTAFVRLNKDIGPAKTNAAAIASGFPKTLPGLTDTNILNTLGTSDARVIDQATGYNTLNSGGQRYNGYLINKVRAFDGSYSYDVKKSPVRAYDKGIADDLAYALNGTGRFGTAAGAQYELGRPMVSKTGTASGNKYIWFNGYTPGQLTTSVGMYYSPDGKKVETMQGLPGLTTQDIYGAGMPEKIWMSFMQAALDGQPVTQLPGRSYWNDHKPSSSTSSSSPTATPSTQRTYSTQPQQSYVAPAPTSAYVAPTQSDAPLSTAQTSQQTLPQASVPTSAAVGGQPIPTVGSTTSASPGH